MELVHEELFQDGGAVEVLGVRGVVRLAICESSASVGDEEALVDVVVSLQPLTHRFHVHRKLDVS